jgi:DNA-binding NtrC family response regulator
MTQAVRLLIADDDVYARTALAALLAEHGYLVETVADGMEALSKLDEYGPDVIITDLNMPRLDGLGLLREALQREPDRPVLIMTASSSVGTAVAAMRAGAMDYLAKPIHFDELLLLIERAMEHRRLKRETQTLRERLVEPQRIARIIGSSESMQAALDTVLQVAPSRASVLITGESGTGKELIAEALHKLSPRGTGPFVKLHCAALSETLLESELFGHERGAFTGALERRAGRFEQANHGTLFLDEIGEISPAVQVKFLRFLQEQEFERVGANQTTQVDVRVIAATHRNLRERVRQGLFREDLYYRLSVVSIEMPPLRQRSSDIGLLAQYFLNLHAKENGKIIDGFTEEALGRLRRHDWPGNVRELENIIERAVVICRGNFIIPENLALPSLPADRADGANCGRPPIPGSSIATLERFAILKTLEATGGSTSHASRILEISPRKIQYRLREYQSDSRASAPAVSSPVGQR